jgi:hypothetical protein
MPPKKAIKKKAAPKKPKRGRKPTKKAAEVSTNNNAAEKTTGHLKKDNYLVIINWLKYRRMMIPALERGRHLLWDNRPRVQSMDLS